MHSESERIRSGPLPSDLGAVSAGVCVNARYLLVVGMPCYVDDTGARWLDSLWRKDLAGHLPYLSNLTLASPRRNVKGSTRRVDPLTGRLGSHVNYVDLPAPTSLATAIVWLPLTCARLWRTVRRADVVHTGIAGWPIPYGWLVVPMARLMGRTVVIVVESAPWRIADGQRASLRRRVEARAFEIMGRWCVSHADICFFTQSRYREELLGPGQSGTVLHASWIDSAGLLDAAHAHLLWAGKRRGKELRLAFFGRLVMDKGVTVLLEAMRSLGDTGAQISLDIWGEGPLSSACATFADIPGSGVHVRLCGTMDYDARFFEVLRQYHAVVVPSISDEQPRIVYDAFSQAVPVLASGTDGLRDCVSDGETGRLFGKADPEALASVVRWASANVESLEEMGLKALSKAAKMTHAKMHETRARAIRDHLARSKG